MAKYTPELLKQIKDLMYEGNSDKEICKKLNLSRSRFYVWKNEKKDFRDIIKKARHIAVANMEGSLYSQGMGGKEFTEEHVHARKEKGTNGTVLKEVTEVKKVKKVALPNVAASIFFLKNRDPENWKEKNEVEYSDKDFEERTKKIGKFFGAVMGSWNKKNT